MKLKNKRAVVTGAASGIGKASLGVRAGGSGCGHRGHRQRQGGRGRRGNRETGPEGTSLAVRCR
jgi:NAD(P)-dependent dehydrogenase (short-subunit alcohol dehydrogenase family)